MTLKEFHDLSFDNPILIYDGVCNFCNRTLQFILKHEKGGDLRFLKFQSEIGQEVLKSLGQDPDNFDSVLLIENGNYHFKSEVTVQFSKYLKSPWNLIRFIKWIPLFIRDFGYDFIAKNRYKIMGKSNNCLLPATEQRSRFLSLT